MGLFGALFAGVSGLDSQSNKIGIISNNISNVNTVGFKQAQAAFNTLVVPSGTTSFSPGGVIGGSQSLVSQQGLIQATSSQTDVAISGGGLLVVNTEADGSGNTYYTRAGSFTQDSAGNFINNDGYYLQGLPVKADGTTAQATSQNLKTVNVGASATGSATATTDLTIAANFDASQTVFPGATVTATMQETNNTYSANADQPATQIIVPGGISNIARGNTFNIVSTSSADNTTTSTTDTYTYGGYTVGRNANSPSSLGDADSYLLTSSQLLNNAITSYAPSTTATSSTQAITNINVANTTTSVVGPTGLFTAGNLTFGNATIALTGGETLQQIATALKGAIDAYNTLHGDTNNDSQVNVTTSPAGNLSLTAIDPNSSSSSFSGSAFTSDSPTYTIGTQTSFPAANQLTLTVPSTSITDGAYAVGGYMSISNASAIGSLTANDINGEQRIVAVDPSGKVTVQLTTPTATQTATTGLTNTGGTNVSINNRTYAFIGNILNATTEGSDLLGTAATNFATSALKFTISVGSNPAITFTYSATPDPTTGTFNTLDNLATAINDATGLSARVQNGQLYVSAQDATQQVVFANGNVAGDNTVSPPLPGINWTQELGLTNLPAATTGTHVFNSIAGLAAQINANDPTNVTAVVSNPTGAASLAITEANPEQTMSLTDGQASTSGSILTELGLTDTAGNLLTNSSSEKTTGTLPITYNASNKLTDMSSGAVTPQYTHDITVYDAQGNAHTIAMNVLKLATNTWAMELTAVPASDVVSSTGDGQLASGTVQFSGTGAILSASPTLTQGITIPWTNGSASSTISVDLGTSGGTNSGLTQASGAFNVAVANQNGSPTGQLTGVSIDANGYVIATFSNGDTQKMFQVPLANVTNPDGLEAVSGDAYVQTLASGIPNLQIAGTSGVGTFSPSSVEESNVDLSTQLTDLIVAQQAYGANSKVLTIADQLLQQLDQIIQ